MRSNQLSYTPQATAQVSSAGCRGGALRVVPEKDRSLQPGPVGSVRHYGHPAGGQPPLRR